MLQNDFFTITALTGEGTSFRAMLELNARHKIFEGHFPGQPVVPGVCLLQMVQEMTEKLVGGPLRLVRADQMKFIMLIDPRKIAQLEMRLEYERKEEGIVRATASVLGDGKRCFTFSGTFVRE